MLIDFAFAGVIGEELPGYMPKWAYSGEKVFDKATDEFHLERYFGGEG